MKGMHSGRRVAVASLLCACIAGCSYDTQCRVDSRVGSLGGCPMDTTPPPSATGNGGGTTPDPIRAPLPTMARARRRQARFPAGTKMACKAGLTARAGKRASAGPWPTKPRHQAGRRVPFSRWKSPVRSPAAQRRRYVCRRPNPGPHRPNNAARSKPSLPSWRSSPPRRTGPHARPGPADARPVASDRGDPQSAHSPGGLRRGSSPRQHDPGRRLSQSARRLSVPTTSIRGQPPATRAAESVRRSSPAASCGWPRPRRESISAMRNWP